MENLTEKEKAAIIYYLYSGTKDKHLIYQIATGEIKYNKLTEGTRKRTVYLWFNSEKIKKAIQYYSFEMEQERRKIAEEAVKNWDTESPKGTKTDLSKDVNFLDRDQFLEFLNKKANTIQDDKLRNDILKMLSDNLRYKDTDTTENNEIQRFYTPVVCSECEIYNKCRLCNVENCKK